MKTRHRTAALLLGLLAAGCGGKPAGSAAPAAPLPPPADAKLAQLYDQTCKACHTNPASGAPQTGSAADWQPRAAQGLDLLVQHAVEGYKGMPPLGSCMDCSEDDLRALIRYMAQLP